MRTALCLAAGLTLLASAAATNAKQAKFNIVPLVSDQAGQAPHVDPNLVNPWGLSYSSSGPAWISDAGTSLSTVYNRSTGAPVSLVVNITGKFPSGQVFNKGSGFKVTKNGHTGASTFIFATLSGTIDGWSSSVDGANTVVAVDDSGEGAVYTGMAIDPTAKHIYTANFANNEVSIYDDTFAETGSFTDNTLPKNFAPFNVAVLNGKVYVAFAKRSKKGDEKAGKGLGYVDVFDLSGNLLQHLISNGDLNAPWGMTIAPAGFGGLDGKLLVGNFGDGTIHAYDADTGAGGTALRGANKKPLKIDGLWTVDAGPGSSVAFTAGPEEETHGLYGLIQPAS
ncbi:MAG: TIGR03118 family protein [Alphaproteobacteria bacterium]|nr:TIGR03118 family protein [Alphaproteobacteria bacterium]